ncbi:MAG: hypothetical protein LBL21_04975 [Rickettsiales bacterium]|jgi:hypothetical protein|nr:hypothetical protein [Rickettsiales bacterium]
MGRKLSLVFSALFLFACGRSESVDLKCGAHVVSGDIAPEVAELKIDGITRALPLQIVFSDEYAAKHVPQYLSNPSFAMTIKTYVGLSLADEKIELAVYSRAGKTEYYELEIEGEKWQCR